MGAKLCVQRTNKSQEADVQRSDPIPQLNDVQAPLASLDLANRCLTLAEQDGKVGLPQPLPLAQAPEHVQEDGVVSAVESLTHENLSGDTLRDGQQYSEREFISHAVLGDLRRWLGGVLAACGMGPSISYNV